MATKRTGAKGATKAKTGKAAPAKREAAKWTKTQEEAFFLELSHICNVSKAMEEAGLGTSHWPLHRRLKKDPEFRAQFDAAIAQGYAMLELEMLERARYGDKRPEPETAPEKKLREVESARALHLLRMHQARVKGTGAAASTQRPLRGAKLRDALEMRLSEISRRLGGAG